MFNLLEMLHYPMLINIVIFDADNTFFFKNYFRNWSSSTCSWKIIRWFWVKQTGYKPYTYTTRIFSPYI